MADGRRRAAALLAAACFAAGATAVAVAVVNGPGGGPTAYVSEAGIPGSAYVVPYRAGVFALAAGLLLLAAALRPVARHAAALLAGGAAATTLSGAVTCSRGCPLPPFERATVADLVHGGASVAAVAACVFAMVGAATASGSARPLRRLGAGGAALALPLSAVIGFAMLALGRSRVVGVLERVLLPVVLLWAVLTALAIAVDRAGGRSVGVTASGSPRADSRTEP